MIQTNSTTVLYLRRLREDPELRVTMVCPRAICVSYQLLQSENMIRITTTSNKHDCSELLIQMIPNHASISLLLSLYSLSQFGSPPSKRCLRPYLHRLRVRMMNPSLYHEVIGLYSVHKSTTHLPAKHTSHDGSRAACSTLPWQRDPANTITHSQTHTK